MSLASSLAPMEHKPEPVRTETEKQPVSRKPTRIEPRATQKAKYTDPDFMQLKVYVRRKTKVAAAHKWENSGGRELSELIETLLSKYLSS